METEEQEILNSYEQGEWQSVSGLPEKLQQYRSYATAALEAEGLVSIVLSQEDLRAVRQRAIEAGMSYQTLIAHLVHQFVSGSLVEKPQV